MKRLIVTADDFGLSREVNEAVIRAHEEGILTCASLMVAAPAAEEAVSLAKRHPSLKVGLHLTLVQGECVLPPAEIPDLVGLDGRFSDEVTASGVRYFFSPHCRRQLRRECAAQVERFLETGLEMDHLNGHNHLHIHPVVLDAVLSLAGRGVRAVRVPSQPLRALPPSAAWTAALMAPWTARTRARVLRAGLCANDEMFGLFETGAMTEEAWLRLLPRLGPGSTEVYCHPATDDRGGVPGYRHADELAALTSMRVRRAVEASGAVLSSFSDIRTEDAGPLALGSPR